MGRELLEEMDVLGMRRETVVVERNHLPWRQFRTFGVFSLFGLQAERASSILKARKSSVHAAWWRGGESEKKKVRDNHNGTYKREEAGPERAVGSSKKKAVEFFN